MRWILFSWRSQTQSAVQPAESLSELHDTSAPNTNVPSSAESWPRPTASVEPPRIESYNFLCSPEPLLQDPAPEPFEQRSYDRFPNAAELPANGVRGRFQQELQPTTASGCSGGDRVPAENGRGGDPHERIHPMPTNWSDVAKRRPDDAMQQLEAIRHETISNIARASNQTDISPPVRRRPLPPSISIYPPGTSPNSLGTPNANTSTWLSNPGAPRLAPSAYESSTVSLGASGLAPPIARLPMGTPGIVPSDESVPGSDAYDVDRPTCSLNLVCYRGGAQGCILRQIQTALGSRFPDQGAFKDALAKSPQIIVSDKRFFRELHRLYWTEMSGFWRRHLSLKTLTGLRLLAVRTP